MNKKIAVISYHTCPLSDEDVTQTGGLNIYVLELSKALAVKGFSIDIFTRQVSKDSPKIVNVSPGLRVVHITAGEFSIKKNELIKHIPDFLENIYGFIDEEKLVYDYVYSHYYLSGIAGLEIKKKFNIPLIINFHTLALMKNLVARSEEEREDIDRIKAEKKILEKADKIVATSNTDALYISALYDYPLDKIYILTPGVDLELFKPMDKFKSKIAVNADLDHKIILFVGRIEPLKGIDVLLYALKILIQRRRKLNICLYIVGGWSREMERLKVIKKLIGIKAQVSFIGQKKQTQLPNYYNAADIVVMPSQYESFGLVALESMACGTPVITTDVMGISTLFDEDNHPLITSASNPVLLAEKIENLLINQEEVKTVKEEILKKAKKLSWEKIADKFINLIRL